MVGGVVGGVVGGGVAPAFREAIAFSYEVSEHAPRDATISDNAKIEIRLFMTLAETEPILDSSRQARQLCDGDPITEI